MVLTPIHRRAPLLVAYSIPAFRKPQIMTRITTIGDERKVLAIAHKAIVDVIRTQKNLVSRRFIVERKLLVIGADVHTQAPTPRMGVKLGLR